MNNDFQRFVRLLKNRLNIQIISTISQYWEQEKEYNHCVNFINVKIKIFPPSVFICLKKHDE